MTAAATLSDLTLAASAAVRASRPATVADLIAGGASDPTLANRATRTVATLREAHAALGADRLAAVLGTLSQAALRCVLARLDASRPGIGRTRRAELLFLLAHIAEGGNTFAEADALQAEPLGAFPGFVPPPACRHEAQMADIREILAGLRIA